MKELSIEEKAKAYDELFVKAKQIYNKENDVLILHIVEDMFPELAEPDDEKIRKMLIEFFGKGAERNGSTNGISDKDILAWLEKQGEKNSTDEPKFKVGDWCIDNQDGTIFQIMKVLDNTYTYKTIENKEYSCTHYSLENDARLWTIQDAKDGDVLCCENGWTCIFKTLVNDETFSSYCFMDKTKWFCETGSECHTLKEEFVKAYNGKIYPATKEQRDTLMKAMADAGWEFDFKKKELKKIEDEPENYKQQVMSEMTDFFKDYIRPNPAWSEDNLSEFESYLCLMFQKFKTKGMCTNGEIVDYVKEHSQKLKDALCHHWSEEDDYNLQCMIAKVTSDIHKGNIGRNNELIDWLKSLKDRVRPQSRKEWSEEDEQYFLVCKNALAKYQTTDKWDAYIISHWLENKLKSLRPQSLWKPTELQMDVLLDEVNAWTKGCPKQKVLESLYNDLKKLKEEKCDI